MSCSFQCISRSSVRSLVRRRSQLPASVWCRDVSDEMICFGFAGKLFPGPHLYAGAAIVTLWAGAGAMVPLMAKGNNTARTVHITFNLTNLALFAWQIPTGLEIVGKVLQFTSLPWASLFWRDNLAGLTRRWGDTCAWYVARSWCCNFRSSSVSSRNCARSHLTSWTFGLGMFKLQGNVCVGCLWCTSDYQHAARFSAQIYMYVSLFSMTHCVNIIMSSSAVHPLLKILTRRVLLWTNVTVEWNVLWYLQSKRPTKIVRTKICTTSNEAWNCLLHARESQCAIQMLLSSTIGTRLCIQCSFTDEKLVYSSNHTSVGSQLSGHAVGVWSVT